MIDRAVWVLVVIGVAGLALTLTVTWGLIGSGWAWVHEYRARFGSPPTGDRTRLLAAIPAGSVAAILLGLYLAAPDPVPMAPLAWAAVAALVVAMGVGLHPEPFLPRWARRRESGRTRGGDRVAVPTPAEREATAMGRVLAFGFGVVCLPMGIGMMSQLSGLWLAGLAMAVLGAVAIVVAVRRRPG